MGMGKKWLSTVGANVGFVWAKWAWVRTGRSYMGPMWAKWAWVRNGHTCLGPVWVVVGLTGHG